MSNDKMREEFEASVLSEYPHQYMGKFATGEYHSPTFEHCWWAWKISREVLVIELPQIVGYEAGYDSIRENEYASQSSELFDAVEVFALCRSIEVREAIEAAGVKVKS